jgi:hypothetical protein
MVFGGSRLEPPGMKVSLYYGRQPASRGYALTQMGNLPPAILHLPYGEVNSEL